MTILRLVAIVSDTPSRCINIWAFYQFECRDFRTMSIAIMEMFFHSSTFLTSLYPVPINCFVYLKSRFLFFSTVSAYISSSFSHLTYNRSDHIEGMLDLWVSCQRRKLPLTMLHSVHLEKGPLSALLQYYSFPLLLMCELYRFQDDDLTCIPHFLVSKRKRYCKYTVHIPNMHLLSVWEKWKKWISVNRQTTIVHVWFNSITGASNHHICPNHVYTIPHFIVWPQSVPKLHLGPSNHLSPQTP